MVNLQSSRLYLESKQSDLDKKKLEILQSGWVMQMLKYMNAQSAPVLNVINLMVVLNKIVLNAKMKDAMNQLNLLGMFLFVTAQATTFSCLLCLLEQLLWTVLCS